MKSLKTKVRNLNPLSLMVLCLVVILQVNTGLAQKGTVGGGGLDIKDKYEGTTWFVGKSKVVRTCFRKDPFFKISDEDLNKVIQNSVSTWKEYYLQVRRDAYDKEYPLGEQTPSFNFTISNACSGDEDLTLHLGTTSREIEIEKLRYNDPVSIANRTKYNKSIGWSKGYIWITRDIINSPMFSARLIKSILIHELGHVFGCGHIKDTIMDEDFTKEIINPQGIVEANGVKTYKYPSDTIDGINQLYPHSGLIKGLIPISFCTNFLGFSCKAKETEWGLASVANVSQSSIEVKFAFNQQEYKFQITNIEDLLETSDNVFGGGNLVLNKNVKIFNTLTEGELIASGEFSGMYGGYAVESFDGGLTLIQRGILSLGQLGSIPVTILRNLDGGSIRIDYKHLNRTYTLFADTYYTKR